MSLIPCCKIYFSFVAVSLVRWAPFAFSLASFIFPSLLYSHCFVQGLLHCIRSFSLKFLLTMHINLFTIAVAVLASLGAATVSKDGGLQGVSNEQSLNPRLTTVPLAARDLPTGTCNAGTPCANGACCSKTNLCGYSKDFCGDGCQHDCEFRCP